MERGSLVTPKVEIDNSCLLSLSLAGSRNPSFKLSLQVDEGKKSINIRVGGSGWGGVGWGC